MTKIAKNYRITIVEYINKNITNMSSIKWKNSMANMSEANTGEDQLFLHLIV